MSYLKPATALFAAALLAVAITACGSNSNSSDSSGGDEASGGLPSTIKVGFLDSMTGPAAFCGQEEKQGAELAIEDAEKEGLLGDAKIELEVKDDKAVPETAVSGMQDLVDDSSIPVAVGPCVGPIGDAVVPIADHGQMPMVVTTASDAPVESEWVFRAGLPQQTYAAEVIPVIAKQAKKAAVIWDKTQSTINGPVWGEAQEPALEEEGVEVVDNEPVTTEQTNFSGQISNVVGSDPEAVGVLLQGTPNLTVVKQLREAGYRGPIWGQLGMAAEFYLQGGPDVNGTFIAVSYAPGFKYPSSVKFTKGFEAKYHKTPRELSAHGYDAMGMALQAIADAGSTDRAAVREALEAMKKFDGAQGPLTFTGEGDARGKGGVVEVHDGDLRTVAQ